MWNQEANHVISRMSLTFLVYQTFLVSINIHLTLNLSLFFLILYLFSFFTFIPGKLFITWYLIYEAWKKIYICMKSENKFLEIRRENCYCCLKYRAFLNWIWIWKVDLVGRDKWRIVIRENETTRVWSINKIF